jgi:low affinity Fe/Cu permease
MPHTETARYDRYTIELYCQHFGTYLNTFVGIERDRVAAVRAQLRELAQQHANDIGREMEVTFHVTQQRRVWFTPDGAP